MSKPKSTMRRPLRGNTPTVLWAAVALAMLIGCGGANSPDEEDGRESSATVFLESEECRDLAAPAVADADAINEMTDDVGTADMDALTHIDFASEPSADGSTLENNGPIHRFSTRLRDVAHKCSTDVLEAYWKAEATFTQANMMWGNDCSSGPCDEAKLRSLLLEGIEDGKKFVSTLERQGTQDEADRAALPEATVNLVGNIRLTSNVEHGSGGDDGDWCYGGNPYNLGYEDQVEVRDATGVPVALGYVDEGRPQGSHCKFNFVAEAVPDQPGVYSLRVGDFDAGNFTLESYRNEGNFGFQLRLGSDD